jgi:hypothetical protein
MGPARSPGPDASYRPTRSGPRRRGDGGRRPVGGRSRPPASPPGRAGSVPRPATRGRSRPDTLRSTVRTPPSGLASAPGAHPAPSRRAAGSGAADCPGSSAPRSRRHRPRLDAHSSAARCTPGRACCELCCSLSPAHTAPGRPTKRATWDGPRRRTRRAPSGAARSTAECRRWRTVWRTARRRASHTGGPTSTRLKLTALVLLYLDPWIPGSLEGIYCRSCTKLLRHGCGPPPLRTVSHHSWTS